MVVHKCFDCSICHSQAFPPPYEFVNNHCVNVDLSRYQTRYFIIPTLSLPEITLPSLSSFLSTTTRFLLSNNTISTFRISELRLPNSDCPTQLLVHPTITRDELVLSRAFSVCFSPPTCFLSSGRGTVLKTFG